MITNPKSAAHAYQQSQNSSMNMRQAMAEAMARIVRILMEAADAYDRRELDVMCGHTTKIFKFLTLLSEALDDGVDADAKQANDYLKETYTTTIYRLANILRSNNPKAEFGGIISQYKYLYKVWT